MCGIAGIVSKSGRVIDNVDRRIRLMSEILFHRGPDYSGVFVSPDKTVAMANTRLSIVDVETAFDVPLVIDQGKQVISFNGEVYNHKELGRKLESKGFKMDTGSDTEVLLRGLAVEGMSFLDQVTGFWSFAYYNCDNSTTRLCRDIMGEKHLFYYEEGDEIIFSSEINPILAVMKNAPEYDLSGIVSSFGCRSAAIGASLIKGIKRLEPGACLEITAGKGVSTYFYSSLDPERWYDRLAQIRSQDELLEVLDQELFTACKLRIPVEVDFVCTLSGGLDSTLINYYIKKHLGHSYNTLYGKSSIVPPGAADELNEQDASRYTAHLLQTRHHEMNMLNDESVSHYKLHASNSFDGVFCEGVPAFSQLASEVRKIGAKVLILSDGPDELLHGYQVDADVLNLMNCNANVSELNSKLAVVSARAIENYGHTENDPFRFVPLHCGTGFGVMKQFLRKEFITDGSYDTYGVVSERYSKVLSTMDNAQKMAMSYCTRSLPDYFNLRTDRGVSLNSVESRLPFQDKNVVELLLAVREKWKKVETGQSKHLLRTLVSNKVGNKIASRNKYGFATPIWHEDIYRKKLNIVDVINDSRVFDHAPFNKNARKFILDDKNKRLQWFAYCLAMTHEKMISKNFSVSHIPL